MASKTYLHLLLLIITCILIGHVIIYTAFGLALIPFPYDYDQAEGFELNNAILLSRGQCPYCDNNIYPFYGSGYPPLFHILMVPFVWIFGPAYWYGRLIIFTATSATALTIGLAVYHTAKHKWVATLSGLAFLASNYIYHIAPLLRQHLLMVFFETLAVYLVGKFFESNKTSIKPNHLIWVILLLLCAGYTKQLAISTCIAIFLWLLIRSPRMAFDFAWKLSVFAGFIFLFWMFVTNGQWWVNIISSNQNPYITEQFIGLLLQFLSLHWPLLVLSLLLLIYELYFSRLSIYSIWFLVSLISTLGAGKWGAGDSYFATTIVAMCIQSGIAISKTLKRDWHLPTNYLSVLLNSLNFNGAYALFSALTLFILLFYSLRVFKFPTSGPIFGDLARLMAIEPINGHRYPLYDSAGWTVGYAVTGHFPSPNDYTNGAKILDKVHQTKGLVMSEDAGFMILDGRDVITNAVQLNNLWQNGLYNPSNLIAMIEGREFGLIILRAGFFPEPVLNAIQVYYAIDETIPMNGFEYQLWRPIPQPLTPS